MKIKIKLLDVSKETYAEKIMQMGLKKQGRCWMKNKTK